MCIVGNGNDLPTHIIYTPWKFPDEKYDHEFHTNITIASDLSFYTLAIANSVWGCFQTKTGLKITPFGISLNLYYAFIIPSRISHNLYPLFLTYSQAITCYSYIIL